MKEIQKHRIGDIVYHRQSDLYLVVTDVTCSTDGYTYYLEYVPKPERYNPLRSFCAGGYSDFVFGDLFEMVLNL